MIDPRINTLINTQEDDLKNILSPSIAIGAIYNLIHLKLTYQSNPKIYILYKSLIEYYITVINTADYGYDNFNFERIENILEQLPYEEQQALLQFSISRISHELPEFDKSWFIQKKNIAEIRAILHNRKYTSFYKIVPLFAGLNVLTLLFTIILIFAIVYLILYPLESPIFTLFTLEYEEYSSNKMVNHLLNLLSVFVDLDNEFKIKPTNEFGAFLIILSKMFFVIVVANYLYIKVTDKLTT